MVSKYNLLILFISRRQDIRLDEVLYFVHMRVHSRHLLHLLRDGAEDRVGRMLAWSGVELAYKLVVELAGRMMTIFDWRRVVVVANHCMVEDMIDCCSSKICYSAKNY